jgi:hypothetical protein
MSHDITYFDWAEPEAATDCLRLWQDHRYCRHIPCRRLDPRIHPSSPYLADLYAIRRNSVSIFYTVLLYDGSEDVTTDSPQQLLVYDGLSRYTLDTFVNQRSLLHLMHPARHSLRESILAFFRVNGLLIHLVDFCRPRTHI